MDWQSQLQNEMRNSLVLEFGASDIRGLMVSASLKKLYRINFFPKQVVVMLYTCIIFR